VVVTFALALALLGPGIAAPFIKDAEPQSAQWIADILSHGRWLLPFDYYHVVMPKPPLFYWLSAIVVRLSGGQVDEVTARAVSLLAAAALAAEVWAWTAARLGAGAAWLAFGFLLGTYGFASRATTALTDMLMTFLLFSTYLMLTARDGLVWWRRRLAAGVLLGLALLTKGPVTMVLLGLAICIYLVLLRKDPLLVLSRPWPWLTAVVGVAIAATWYVPAFVVGHGSHFAKVFLQENAGHFMPPGAGGTGEAARPVYYIAARLIGGSLPLSLLIPALAIAFTSGAFKVDARRDLLYQLAMVLAVLVLFSAASAKRDDYILPALPPLAILFAALFSEVERTEDSEAWLTSKARDLATLASATMMLLGTFSILILIRSGAGIGRLGIHLQSADESYAAIFAYGLARLTPPFALFLAAIVGGATVTLAGFWFTRPLINGMGLAVLCVAGSILWTSTVRPREASTRSLAAFAADVRSTAGSAPVFVAHLDPEFSWYYGRGVPALPEAMAIAGPPRGGKVYFVGRPGDLAHIAPPVREQMVRVVHSHVLGGGGPPALYLFGPSR